MCELRVQAQLLWIIERLPPPGGQQVEGGGGAHLFPQVSQCKFQAWVTGLGERVPQQAEGQEGWIGGGLRVLSEKGTGKLAEGW